MVLPDFLVVTERMDGMVYLVKRVNRHPYRSNFYAVIQDTTAFRVQKVLQENLVKRENQEMLRSFRSRNRETKDIRASVVLLVSRNQIAFSSLVKVIPPKFNIRKTMFARRNWLQRLPRTNRRRRLPRFARVCRISWFVAARTDRFEGISGNARTARTPWHCWYSWISRTSRCCCKLKSPVSKKTRNVSKKLRTIIDT